MADNGIGENENLNSARAVKPGSLFSDMSKFANLTQEEASYETLDKVNSIDERLESIESKLDRIGEISKSLNNIYDVFKQTSSSLKTRISNNDRKNLADRTPKPTSLPPRERAFALPSPKAFSPIVEVSLDGLRPVISDGFSMINQTLEKTSIGLLTMVGAGISKITPLFEGGFGKLVPQIVGGLKEIPKLAYDGMTTTRAITSPIHAEIIEAEELGNVWEESGIDSEWSGQVVTSVEESTRALVAIAGSVGTLVNITQKNALETQAKELVNRQTKVKAQEGLRFELPELTLPTQLPEKANGILEWLGRLVGFSDTTIGFLGFIGSTLFTITTKGFNLISKGLKVVGDWFFKTKFGEALLKDVSKMWQYIRVNWKLAWRGSSKSWFGWIGKTKDFIIDGFKGLGTSLKSQFGRLFNWFGRTGVGRLFRWISVNTRLALRGSSKSWFGWIGKLGSKIGEFLGKMFPNVSKLLGGSALKAGSKIASKIPVLGLIISGIDAVRRFLEGDFLGSLIAVLEGITSTIPVVGTAISVALGAINIARDFGWGKEFTERFNNFFKETWDKIKEFFVVTFTSIGMLLEDTWNSVTTWTSEITKPIREKISSSYEWISKWASILIDTTLGTIKDAWNGLTDSFKVASEFIWDTMTSFAISTYETVRAYIQDWFGIDITALFLDLKNKVVASWNKGKEYILSIPSKAEEAWKSVKGFIGDGLVLAGSVMEKVWKGFTDPIKKKWDDFVKGTNDFCDTVGGWFKTFNKGIEDISKWLESIDPWEEIENGLKKLGDLISAIPTALKKMYNTAIESIPGAGKLFNKYEIPGEKIQAEPEKVSLTSMVENASQNIGKNVSIHEQTLRDLEEAKKELEGTSSLFSPYQVQALKSKVWELEQRAEREEALLNKQYGKDAWKDLRNTAKTESKITTPQTGKIPVTASEKIAEMREMHKQIAKERAEHIDEINALNKQMESIQNPDWNNSRVSGVANVVPVMHASATPLPEYKQEAPLISAQTQEIQKIQPIKMETTIVEKSRSWEGRIEPSEDAKKFAEMMDKAYNPDFGRPSYTPIPEYKQEAPVISAQPKKEIIKVEAPQLPEIKVEVPEVQKITPIKVEAPQLPETNRNAELLYETVKQQIKDNGSTIGNCAKAINDATIAIGASNERGHAYEKIAQFERNKNFEDITAQYKNVNDLKNLPKGAVVVWDKSKEKPYGHVSVADGKGGEVSDHWQTQTLGTDKKGRAYGAYHVFMPKADADFSVPPEKSMWTKFKETISFGNDDLRKNTEALQANTEATDSNSEAYDPEKQKGIIDKMRDALTSGLAYSAEKGAQLVDWLDKGIMGSSVPDLDAIVGGMKNRPIVSSNLAMVGGSDMRDFEIPVESEMEDTTQQMESPLPQAEENRKAEEQRIEEMNQRPITVVAPPIASAPENKESNNTTSPSLDDAVINDIRLLAINQGLC